ncbi:NTF2 fold immunity protein [Pseudomonas alkylphenolica]|uniref:NTF2 fold immunity protein n=1 Tax=Pseudomonas alkylphenolica TaxID=237609 RepID=UPI00315D2F3C
MSESKKVLEVVEAFMKEMCDWESKFFEEKMKLVDEGKGTSDCNKKYKDLLGSIFLRYSIRDGRTWARLELLGSSSPAMYDPLRDQVSEPEIIAGKAYVEVQQVEGFESKFRFGLVCVDGEWKIKRKDTFRNGKWEKSSL